MVALQRANLHRSGAPNPSVETLLHAFLPHNFVDHTHVDRHAGLVDQPNGEALCREVFGARMGFVPYIMPGSTWPRRRPSLRADPTVEGLVLDKHGIFSFGDERAQAYERMIAAVTAAEAYVAAHAHKTPVERLGPARPLGGPASDLAAFARRRRGAARRGPLRAG